VKAKAEAIAGEQAQLEEAQRVIPLAKMMLWMH
jgi:hypothetical protein